MKASTTLKWLLAVALAGLAATLITAALAQPKSTRATREFMREKLGLSQKVLEGIALEDFALIESQARRLSAMSKEPPWQVVENPDYAQHSLGFRRQADALVRAAKEKNLDAVTLAYVRMTMNCVDCHKFVRGKEVAELGPENARSLAGLASSNHGLKLVLASPGIFQGGSDKDTAPPASSGRSSTLPRAGVPEAAGP